MKSKCFIKSIIAIVTLLAGMLLLPVLFVRLSPPDAGLAVGMLLFFLVNPLICLGLGILAGTHFYRVIREKRKK